MLDDILGDISPALAISVVVVGFGLLVSLAAYLLPGVRVVRSIAGVVCILAAVVILLVSFDAGPDDQTLILATMILLSALIISVRPEWKPKAQAPQPYRPAAPQPQPYPPQSPPSQPQQQSHQQQTPHQQQSPQRQLQQNIQTPPAMHQPQPSSPQQQASTQQQPGAGYPGSGA